MYCTMLSCILGLYPLNTSSMSSPVVKLNIAGHLQMSPDEQNHSIIDNTWVRAGFLTTWPQLPPKHTGFQGHPRSAEMHGFPMCYR